MNELDDAIAELKALWNEPNVTAAQIIVHRGPNSYSVRSYGCDYKTPEALVAEAIVKKGYATGHGDTIEDLLAELEWQVAERVLREAAAQPEWVGLTKEDFYKKDDETVFVLGMKFAEARLKEKNA